MLRSPTTGTSKASVTSTVMGRVTFSGATTAGRSISGRWMAWGSKWKAASRTLRSPTIGTFQLDIVFADIGGRDESAAELAVASKFEPVINLKAAKALG